MWLYFFNQSNCDIYALIQSEMEPHTSGPSVRDNAIFKTMCVILSILYTEPMLDYMEKKRFSGEDSGSLRVRLHAANSRGGAIERPNEVDFARRPVGDLPSAHINLEVSVQAVKFDRIPNKRFYKFNKYEYWLLITKLQYHYSWIVHAIRDTPTLGSLGQPHRHPDEADQHEQK